MNRDELIAKVDGIAAGKHAFESRATAESIVEAVLHWNAAWNHNGHRVREDCREIMLAIDEIPGLAEIVAKNTGHSGRPPRDIRASATRWIGVEPDADGHGLRCSKCRDSFVPEGHADGLCHGCAHKKKDGA